MFDKKKAKKRPTRGQARKKSAKLEKSHAKQTKTVKKNALKQFLLEKERLHYLLSATTAVIYTSKTKGDYGATFITDNVTQLVGYSPEEFLREPSFWLDHVHPDDRHYVLEEVKRVLKEKKYTYEYRFLHKGGRYIWVRDEMRLVCDEKGKPLEVIGYWTDITEHKEMEMAFKESSERLQKFMDSATEGFILFDAQLNVIDVNDYLLKKFNVKKKDIIGVNMLDFSIGAWETGRYDLYRKVMETGEPCVLDDVVTPSAWGDLHVALKAFKVGDGLGMIVRDITEQKQIEEKLQASEERFRTLYESIQAGVIVQSADGEIVHANKIACRIFSVLEEEILGAMSFKPFKNVINEAGEKLLDEYNPFFATRHTRKPLRNVVVAIYPDDFIRLRWLLASTEPILDYSTGKLEEVIITFIDITQRKEIEAAFRESEERYKHIFDECPIGIGIGTLNGKVITGNKAMEKMTGYSIEELRKLNLADTYENPKERNHLFDILNKRGTVTDYPVRLKRKDGTLYDALLSMTRITIGGKDFIHTICQEVPPLEKLQKHMHTHRKKGQKS
jgi:PAS domain S-box-containing protein